jgi:glycosyltransferase involved in cell wall biosynthesis
MKIAVSTRLLIDGKLDGIGWFSYHTMQRIVSNHPEHQFVFIFDRKYDNKFIFAENVEAVVLPPPTRHPLLWFYWLRFSLPRFLRKLKPDLFISLDGFMPYRLASPSLCVIHDINFVHYPEDLPYFSRKFYNSEFPKFARMASRIATVSEFSKQDIVSEYGISEDKISVVYNGASLIYKPVDIAEKEKTKSIYSDSSDYFIFVGSIHPRKNLLRLIRAFELFKLSGDYEHKLIVVGDRFFKNSELFRVYEHLNYRKDIIFTGRLSAEELSKVLAAATALVFVPYFEGFGIPIIEAMNCDVPVISANVTSMPEVGGEAVLYVNPFDIEEIAGAMKRIAEDEFLRQELVEKGREQRKKFSWAKTADKMWQVVEKVLSEK